MEKSSSEANNYSPSEEIIHPLWKLKAHYHVHKRPLSGPMPCHVNSVNLLTHFKVNFNILLSMFILRIFGEKYKL
jgi:hypothetical protein